MRIELRHLRVLIAIGRAGSLSRAAGSLGSSQPALTTQLRRIERLAGGPLFDRGRSGVVPTALGRYMIDGAQGVLAHLDMLWSGTPRRRLVQVGAEVRVAGPPGPLLAAVPTAVRGVLPGCRTATQSGHPVPLCVELLSAGRLDLAILPDYPGAGLALPDDLASRRLAVDEPMALMVAASHRLAGHDVDLADLALDEWVIPTPTGSLLGHLHASCADHGFSPVIRHHASDLDTVAGLLAATDGVALLDPLRAAPDGMVRLSVPACPLRRGLLLAWRRGGPVAGHGLDLCEALRATHRRLAAGPDHIPAVAG